MNRERQFLLQWDEDLVVMQRQITHMLTELHLYPKNIMELSLVKTKLQELRFWIDEALGYDNTKGGK